MPKRSCRQGLLLAVPGRNKKSGGLTFFR